MADKIIIVNPDDVHLADVKAVAAKRNASVIGNPHCPHGQMFVIDGAVAKRWKIDG